MTPEAKQRQSQIRTFQNLPIGAVFEFELAEALGLIRGPWRKISLWCYTHVHTGGRFHAGTLRVVVIPAD